MSGDVSQPVLTPNMYPRIQVRSLGSLLFCLIAGFFMASSQGQERVYKCDNNVYTNNPQDPRVQGCKPMDGANVTVVQGTRPAAAPASPGASAANSSGGAGAAAASRPRVESSDQRARDNDARLILESELKKAEARQAEMLKDYNNGEPEKLGAEMRNHQKYLDRVAELKAAIVRNESDMAGIRRELGRLPAR
ncbi:MAG: hypothetical protein RLZZ591_763 [Pseudomonadota bacterium]|jgi:hypothetical protein